MDCDSQRPDGDRRELPGQGRHLQDADVVGEISGDLVSIAGIVPPCLEEVIEIGAIEPRPGRRWPRRIP